MVPAEVGLEAGEVVGVSWLEAAAFEVFGGEGADAAAAIEAVGRVVGFPDGIVEAVDFAVHGAVHGAGAGVHDGDVLPEGAVVGVFGLCFEAAGGEGGGEVGVDDGADAVGGAAEFTGFGVGPPPAGLVEFGLQVGFHLGGGVAFGDAFGDDFAGVGEQVGAGHLGDGEGAGVGFGGDGGPVAGDEVALGAEEGYGVGGGEFEGGGDLGA